MKVSDIITYILKIKGFGFKKIRSSFRDMQKSAKSQDLEYSCTQTGVDKAGWFLKSQEQKYTKLSQRRNMRFSNISTLLEINLSYFKLFY